MTDLLGIGASGVRAYGTALAAIGNNVANANTTGYTRRTVSLVENDTGSANQLGYINRAQFGGVLTADVGRAWNDYQATAMRTTASDAGRADARASWLGNTESALDDGATGVGQSATALFDAGDALAADPGSSGNRQIFLAAVDQTATAFRTTASALADVSTGIATSGQTAVQSVNANLDAIDKVNAALKRTPAGTAAQADLLDQRDSLLDSLSTKVGIDVTIGADGSAAVKLSGSGTVLATGGVGGGARLTMTVGGNGALAVQAVSNGSSQPVTQLGGQIGGLVESAGTVADRRTSLDAMASSFASALNGWQAAGRTASGAAGAALVSGTSAATLQVATADPTAIAAASPDGTANGNLLALSALRGGDGVEQRWSAMVTDQGQMVAAAKSENSAASTAADAASTARDQSTGVDLDTEAAELVRYQQAYSGAAKVIQVAQATMQSILDLF